MDVRELRNCFGHFATGVTVVTWKKDDRYHGITVNAFTSVSLDPPLLLVSIDKKAKACSMLEDRPFVVNILSSDQEKTAWQFAGKEQEGFEVEWEETDTGPRLKGALANFECMPWQRHEAGDHILYLGEIKEFSYGNGEPLMFCRGKFLNDQIRENQRVNQ
ncbi:flavin reductase family protein [Alteribacter natronophilus]|uniref:flavin reductase family protein n=1 Tax=Alteribacter natronophilus TaxID=2583810 RepID=UPI00110F367B|nr:flavin reductase family protein [Alteribacter natronophilus]TMW70616.1 flavin reductase [Alteribacter natronophilus]